LPSACSRRQSVVIVKRYRQVAKLLCFVSISLLRGQESMRSRGAVNSFWTAQNKQGESGRLRRQKTCFQRVLVQKLSLIKILFDFPTLQTMITIECESSLLSFYRKIQTVIQTKYPTYTSLGLPLEAIQTHPH